MVFFDHHAAQRAFQRIGLVDLRAAAVELEPRLRALQLGFGSRVIGFRRVQIFCRCHAVFVQVPHAREVLLRQRVVALRAARVGLRLAEIGRSDDGKRLAGLNLVARLHQDAADAAGKRRVNAHRLVFVPGQPAVQDA